MTVVANDTIVVRGYTTTVTSPIDPDLSLVYGTAKNFRGVASQGLVISAKRKSGVAVDTSGTFIIGPQYQFDTTDANGFFSFDLIRTALYKDTTEGLYTITGTYRTTLIFTVDSVRVPDTGDLDISTLID